MKILTCFLLVLSGAAYGQTLQRIPLKVLDAYQTNNPAQDVTYLLDGDHSTRFISTYQPVIKPHDVVFDLSDYAPCTIKRLVLYDGLYNGYDCKFVLVSADGKEDTVYTFTGDGYFQSDTIDLPVEKQYVASRLILRNQTGLNGYPDDLEVWGTFTSHPDPVVNRPKIPLRNLLGVNVHSWDIDFVKYPTKYQPLIDLGVSSLRLFLDADLSKDPNGNYGFNPQYGGGFHPEEAFAKIKREHPEIFTQACYHRQSLDIETDWKAVGISSQLNFPYSLNNDKDRLDPATYSNMGKDLFVMAEREGKNKALPDYPLWISQNWWETKNQMIKGEGFYDAIEGGNEWNAWWAGYNGFMNGSQMAAAWSMMYDGHKGKYPNMGVKQADRNVLFTNGGVALPTPDIFHEAIDWWKINRGYLPDGSVDIPVDYFSFHCYPMAGSQYSGSVGGLPPEMVMLPYAKGMVDFSNHYAGGKPIYIGEWGYDVNPGSPVNAPAFGRYNAEQTRAMWSIRAICTFSEAGIGGAQWYRAYQDYYPGDPNGGNWTSDHNSMQFATMALLRVESDGVQQVDGSVTDILIHRTMVGDYFKQFGDLYGNYTFDQAVRSDSVYVLRFTKDTNTMYVVWGMENVVTSPYSRPIITERTGIYNLTVPMNAIIRTRNFRDDGSGRMDSTLDVAIGTNFTVNYSARPQVIEIAGRGIILPVQLVSFTAVRKDRAVQLDWSVQNEELANYTVEKSANARDYQTVSVTNATGKINYRSTDDAPYIGKNFYRLKMNDKNGGFKYSQTRLVVIDREKVRYTAYNFLGQKLYEGDDFMEVDNQARMQLKPRQAYIIKGTDGTVVKLICNR